MYNNTVLKVREKQIEVHAYQKNKHLRCHVW